MTRLLRVQRIGMRVDLDDDRTDEIRASEHDDLAVWTDTFAAVAAGDEVFVTAQFFAQYAGDDRPSLGLTYAWHTLSTRQDATEELVRLADIVYDEGWPTELADVRIAGCDIERPVDRLPERVIVVGDDLPRRIVLSPPAGTAWRIEPEPRAQRRP